MCFALTHVRREPRVPARKRVIFILAEYVIKCLIKVGSYSYDTKLTQTVGYLADPQLSSVSVVCS